MKQQFGIIFRVVLISILCLVTNTSEAKIKTEKAAGALIVRMYIDDYANVTMELLEQDFAEALSVAQKRKCKTLMIYDNSGNPYYIVTGKEKFQQTDKQLEKLREIVDGMTTTEYIKGKVKSSKQVKVCGPKYRSETYLNGRLVDTYETDWSQGPFKATTSTYRTSGDTYLTKTFYVPAKYKTEEEYEPGTSIVKEGILRFAEEVYYLE